jgi:hypothetical protein
MRRWYWALVALNLVVLLSGGLVVESARWCSAQDGIFEMPVSCFTPNAT